MPTIEEAIASVQRVWREFKRYTGDGLPGEPTNADLPVGDPSSSVHHPKKSELRGMMTDALDAVKDALEDIATGAVPDNGVTRPKLSASLSRALGLSVSEYGAAADGTTDDGAASAAAQAAAVAAGFKLIVVPQGDYRINTSIPIASSVTWLFLGARLYTTQNAINMLEADGTDDWAILGKVELVGTLTSSADTGQNGLRIENVDRAYIEGVTARDMKGRGFLVTGTDAKSSRGDRARFHDCAAYDSFIGRELTVGAGAEYTTWTNWQASGCSTGDEIGAANTMTVGGSITDNSKGVALRGTGNHGHGIYVGVSINHNTVYNLEAHGISEGMVFANCNFYGNGGGAGAILLRQCQGIVFDGGIIDCYIYNLGGAMSNGKASAENWAKNVFMPGSYGPVQLLTATGDDGTGLSKFVFDGCHGKGAYDANKLIINNVAPWLSFNASGILAGSQGVTLNRNGNGDYTLTFRRPFTVWDPAADSGNGAFVNSADYSVSVGYQTNGSGHQGGFSVLSQTATTLRLGFYVDNGSPVLTDCTKMTARAAS